GGVHVFLLRGNFWHTSTLPVRAPQSNGAITPNQGRVTPTQRPRVCPRVGLPEPVPASDCPGLSPRRPARVCLSPRRTARVCPRVGLPGSVPASDCPSLSPRRAARV